MDPAEVPLHAPPPRPPPGRIAMRKIRLNLDDLAVESFGTADGKSTKAGTVRAHDSGTDFDGCASYYSNCATCQEGCPQDTLTCFGSCRMTGGLNPCIDPDCW